jgi:hypothetical protein
MNDWLRDLPSQPLRLAASQKTTILDPIDSCNENIQTRPVRDKSELPSVTYPNSSFALPRLDLFWIFSRSLPLRFWIDCI